MQKLQSVNLLGEKQPVSRMHLLRGQSVQFHDTFRGSLVLFGDIPETAVITNDKSHDAGHFLKTFQILRGFLDLCDHVAAGRGEYNGTDAQNYFCFDF